MSLQDFVNCFFGFQSFFFNNFNENFVINIKTHNQTSIICTHTHIHATFESVYRMIGYLFIYLSTYLALYGEKSSYYVGFVVAHITVEMCITKQLTRSPKMFQTLFWLYPTKFGYIFYSGDKSLQFIASCHREFGRGGELGLLFVHILHVTLHFENYQKPFVR